MMVAVGDVTFAGLVRSNKTAAFIINQLKQECSRDKIVNSVFEKYDASKEVITEDVDYILDLLRKIGALEE